MQLRVYREHTSCQRDVGLSCSRVLFYLIVYSLSTNMSYIAPTGDHAIQLAWLPVGPLPPVPPAPESGPAVVFRPEYIGIRPYLPPSDPTPAYLFPFLEEWEIIYVGKLGSPKRWIKHKRTGQYLQPNYIQTPTSSKTYIEAADNIFEWVLKSETSEGVESWYISTEYDGAEWAIGLELYYAAPPGEEGVLRPISLPPLILKHKAGAARWTFPDIYHKETK
ncbi:hypothetical protein BDN72DRAFT_848901 [Pluteus cervinus]|uniref:Uncharacterized protein n=1 Tax=Pluteus cervinus TaxID=181527 RepID=A0ACD3A940_9AGAR|nr:hypothetical protein BDN72DRAFT_848901 [Pluteus cervinus]